MAKKLKKKKKILKNFKFKNKKKVIKKIKKNKKKKKKYVKRNNKKNFTKKKKKIYKKSKIKKSKKIKKKNKKKAKIKKIIVKEAGPSFFQKLKDKLFNYLYKLKIKFLIFIEKFKIKKTKQDLKKLSQLLKEEKKLIDKFYREKDQLRIKLIKDIKREERQKIYNLKDHLWKVSDRFSVIKERYKNYRQKIREQQLEELEIRRKSREEARIILEAEKAENALKQQLVERLERFSRNMKSIVFQINKRYITKKRSPLRFIDNITESGECLIKNDDAPTDKDYLILLYIEGENVKERLKNPICLDDKTDIGSPKNFKPKNIFEASDYIIDRLAIMFDKERKLKK
jgi:hypothetical protein